MDNVLADQFAVRIKSGSPANVFLCQKLELSFLDTDTEIKELCLWVIKMLEN